MSNIEYIESEKYWRAPDTNFKNCGLGQEILENLKNSNPEKVYEILHDTGTRVTVKEIHDQTITVAHNLLNLGVNKGDTVVFFSFLNLKITPLTFACYIIGAPVCFFETYLDEELMPEYLERLDPAVLIYENKYKSMLDKAIKSAKLSNLKHLLSLDGIGKSEILVEELLFKPIVEIENFEVPDISNPKAEPAVLAFTSGTTGSPKIVIISHELMKCGISSAFRSTPGDVLMVLSELRWLCQVYSMLQPAFFDVIRVYSSTSPADLTGKFIVEMVNCHKVTRYFEIPRVCQTVLEACESNRKALSSLQFVFLGGDNISDSLIASFSKIIPNCKLGNSYGLTDVAGPVAFALISPGTPVKGGTLRDGMMVKIIDGNNKPLGQIEIGTICLKSSTPFLGYLKNDKANNDSFIADGWFNTGDLGMVDSKNLLHAVNRDKYCLKYANGRILLPNAIENTVGMLEGVDSVALVGRPNEKMSDEDCGTIFVVARNDVGANRFESELRNYLRKALTAEELEIVKYFKVIDMLPRTTCFKVDRMALKKMCAGEKRILE